MWIFSTRSGYASISFQTALSPCRPRRSPKASREKVWEPFYRLDRDASSAVAGSGIGLSVVRELATKIAEAQQAELVTMEQLLRERGGQPLP